MSAPNAALIELLLIFGAVLAFGFWKLYSVDGRHWHFAYLTALEPIAGPVPEAVPAAALPPGQLQR